jgi:hypothetical protein
MMRSGFLLAEDSPQNLLNKHNLVSLEDVFLKLCVKQQVQNRDLSVASLATTNNNTQHLGIAATKKQGKNRGFKFNVPSPQRVFALLHKNFLQLFRNVGYNLFKLKLYKI